MNSTGQRHNLSTNVTKETKYHWSNGSEIPSGLGNQINSTCGRMMSETSPWHIRVTGLHLCKTVRLSDGGWTVGGNFLGRPTITSFLIASYDYELHFGSWDWGLSVHTDLSRIIKDIGASIREFDFLLVFFGDMTWTPMYVHLPVTLQNLVRREDTATMKRSDSHPR